MKSFMDYLKENRTNEKKEQGYVHYYAGVYEPPIEEKKRKKYDFAWRQEQQKGVKNYFRTQQIPDETFPDENFEFVRVDHNKNTLLKTTYIVSNGVVREK